jgi:hypothetical protein
MFQWGSKMILYQEDENNLMASEYQQLETAQSHLEIMEYLFPNHRYHIFEDNFIKNYSSPNMATPLIKNFG